MKITVSGSIDTITKYEEVKKELSKVEKNSSLDINFRGSRVISSSFIGQILKLKVADNVDINITVDDENLYNLFGKLGLSNELKVTKA